MKNLLVRFLVWSLGKLSVETLVQCTIVKDCSFKISKFIPDDNKWHHMAMTVEYWIKLGADKKQEERFIDAGYVDGVQIDEFSVSRGVEQKSN